MLLTTLSQWLAGEFDNQAQAIDQPVWFVHLRLWYRPLPLKIEGNLALFAEQVDVLQADRPYRQRVVQLKPTHNPQVLQAQYWAFQQPDRFRGAGADPRQLQGMSLADLEFLPGCLLTVTQQGNRFEAKPDSEVKCCFQYDGQTRQVVLGFEVSENKFSSYDRGIDPKTGAGLWGALMGAYEFQKRHSFDWP